jgi:hypothetical protein
VVSVPDKTYELTFLYKEGGMDKGQVFSDMPTALEAFKKFLEPASADIYSGITLTEYDWKKKQERIVAALAL